MREGVGGGGLVGGLVGVGVWVLWEGTGGR
jgi:hypothetical protein